MRNLDVGLELEDISLEESTNTKAERGNWGCGSKPDVWRALCDTESRSLVRDST